jgi:hypothetical protein
VILHERQDAVLYSYPLAGQPPKPAVSAQLTRAASPAALSGLPDKLPDGGPQVPQFAHSAPPCGGQASQEDCATPKRTSVKANSVTTFRRMISIIAYFSVKDEIQIFSPIKVEFKNKE